MQIKIKSSVLNENSNITLKITKGTNTLLKKSGINIEKKMVEINVLYRRQTECHLRSNLFCRMHHVTAA